MSHRLPTNQHSQAMNGPTDKDYIGAKLQAVIERLNGDIRMHQTSTDARLDKIDHTIEHGLQAVRDEFNTKLAQVEANCSRALTDAIKWMIGTMIALTMLSITVTSVLFLHVAPKLTLPVKAPPSAASSPRSGPTAGDGKTWSASLALVAQSSTPAAIHPATAATKTAR